MELLRINNKSGMTLGKMTNSIVRRGTIGGCVYTLDRGEVPDFHGLSVGILGNNRRIAGRSGGKDGILSQRDG